MKRILFIAAVAGVVMSSGVYAHSGGTDRNGGHNCSQASKEKGLCTGYHYHLNGYAYRDSDETQVKIARALDEEHHHSPDTHNEHEMSVKEKIAAAQTEKEPT